MSVHPWFALYAKQLIRGPTNALNTPLGEYDCKAKIQRNLRRPTQAMEHVVLFNIT